MTTTILNIIIQLIEAAVTQFPQLVTDFQELFAGGAPTPADFAALRAKVAGESYDNFVPGGDLPPVP